MTPATSFVRALAVGFVLATLGLGGPVAVQARTPGDDRPPQGAAEEQTAPITIMAVGNRLVVTSDDTEAMKLVNELVRLLTKSDASAGDFTVIPLRNARAADAAQLIDQCYNGTGPNNGGGRGMGFG